VKTLAALLLATLSLPALAEPQAPSQIKESGGCYLLIGEIAFEGNEQTEPKVMLREMVVEVGDPAEPELIEKSRQGVLDLGLFKKVTVREEIQNSSVRLVFTVDERIYLLPLPRLDIKSDGQYSYGASLRWANVFGLNHTLRAAWTRSDRKRHNIGLESTASASYTAPFAFDSPYQVDGGFSYTQRPVEIGDSGAEYNEDLTAVAAGASRTFSGGGPASQGWTLGAGLLWSDEHTSGALAPPAYGAATAPYLTIAFRDFHNRIYSDVGTSWFTRFEMASETLGSDYHYSNWSGSIARYLQLGSTEHQTLHLIGSFGLYFGGPASVHPYGLGGSSTLRGYESNFREGDGFYLVQVEAARPIWKPWLRGVVILEAGNVFEEAEDFNLRRVRTSLGLGLRVRFTNFVNFELEAGYAIPLDGGSGRFFASRV
jgi:outer membrane protein assembly factor BamA